MKLTLMCMDIKNKYGYKLRKKKGVVKYGN